MNKKNVQSLLQKMAEDEFSLHSIDLWPNLKQTLVTRNSQSHKQGEIKMNKRIFGSPSSRWALVVGLLLVCFCTFLFATPQGKVLAQDIVNFFTRNDSNEQTIPTIAASLQPQSSEIVAVTAPPEEAADASQFEGCGTILSPRCGLDEVQALTDFEIQVFQQTPPDMSFAGATTIANGILIKYIGENGELLIAEQKIADNFIETWTIGKDATVQSLLVNQQPADYVVGIWIGLGIMNGEVAWDESIPAHTLRWKSGDIQYTLINFPGKIKSGSSGYDQDQLRQMAEEIGTASTAEALTLAADSLPLAEAESLAGFEFIESDWNPAGLALRKTTYSSQHNSICQYYHSRSDRPTSPTLVLAQSTWAMPGLDELQSKVFFNGKPITIGLAQEMLPIQGADGGEGQFYETGLQIDAICGGEPTTTNRVLLWQQGSRSFALFSKLDSYRGGSFVTKMELQHLAALLNSVTAQDEINAPDPERLLSLADAQSLADFPVLQPAMMLSNVNFDHMSFGTYSGGPMRMVSFYASVPTGNGLGNFVQIIQTPNSESSLEQLRLAGGYHDVTINETPAIYQAQCSDSMLYGPSCYQMLTWFDGDTQFDINTNFPAVVPEETVIAIAESMR